jgi:hypothetical protein
MVGGTGTVGSGTSGSGGCAGVTTGAIGDAAAAAVGDSAMVASVATGWTVGGSAYAGDSVAIGVTGDGS